MESCVVDGKRVYRKSYPKKEFRSLTKAQREAVIRMHKEHRSSLQDKRVSAVQEVSHHPPSDTPDVQPSSNKRKADAGSVGSFIQNRRSRK